MGILLVLICTIMWSFVSIFVKTASVMVDSFTISFFRFFFGVVFLFLIVWFRQGKVRIDWKEKWIWYGALGKASSYIFENLGISIGYAFEQVLVNPMTMLCMMFTSIVIFRERFTIFHAVASFLCISGILLLKLNGLSFNHFLHTNWLVISLFAICSIGSCVHLMSQKILIDKMNSENMNLSVFFWASFMTFTPLPFAFEPVSHGFNGWAIFALVALGFITGVSFYIYGIGAKKISFLTSSLLLNVTVLFTLLWSYLFFDEPITLYTIAGSLLFIGGIAVVNIPTIQMMSRKRTDPA